MKKRLIKYYCAVVVIVMTAAALSSCNHKEDEIVLVDERDISEDASKDIDLQMHQEEYADVKSLDVKNEKGESNRSIYVYVCGAVLEPNVYELSEDARIIDAINAAGGVTKEAGTQYLNLASIVSDGQKIYVPTENEIEEALAAGNLQYSTVVNITSNQIDISDNYSSYNSEQQNSNLEQVSNNGRININTASSDELQTLQGIGASKAQKIIDYREFNGEFSCIEDIMLIPGIKEGMFNKIKDSICVR